MILKRKADVLRTKNAYFCLCVRLIVLLNDAVKCEDIIASVAHECEMILNRGDRVLT